MFICNLIIYIYFFHSIDKSGVFLWNEKFKTLFCYLSNEIDFLNGNQNALYEDIKYC